MRRKLIELGGLLGLDNKEIVEILSQTPKRNEHPSLTAGPNIYGGAWYGTISIYDF